MTNGDVDMQAVNGKADSVLPAARQYHAVTEGPYKVIIRTNTETEVKADAVKIAKHMSTKYKSARQIRPVNADKVIVLLENREEANRMPSDTFLATFKTFIPAEECQIDGRIKLSPDSAEQELLLAQGIFIGHSRKVKILDVYRHKYKKEDGTLESSANVVVTFEGTQLPDFVSNADSLYVPVLRKNVAKDKICSLCLLIGHSDRNCTRKKKRCSKCASTSHTSDCMEDNPNCRICKEQHETVTCPTLKANFMKKVERQATPSNFYETLRNTKEKEPPRIDGWEFPAISRKERVAFRSVGKKEGSKKKEDPKPSSSQDNRQPGTKTTRDGTSFAEVLRSNKKRKTQNGTDKSFDWKKLLSGLKMHIPDVVVQLIEEFIIPLVGKVWIILKRLGVDLSVEDN